MGPCGATSQRWSGFPPAARYRVHKSSAQVSANDLFIYLFNMLSDSVANTLCEECFVSSGVLCSISMEWSGVE